MNGIRIGVVGCLLLCLAGMPVCAQRENKANDGMQKQYAAMVASLNLSVEQQTTFNDKVKALQDGLAAWDQQHREQMGKLEQDLRTADKDAKPKLQEQLRPLKEERSKLEASLRKAVMDVLTSEQQQRLAGLKIYQEKEYPTMVKVLVLNVDQDAKLKDAATAYAAGQGKWEQENGEKAHQLEQQIKEAQNTLNAIRAQREKLETDLNAAVKAVLTPEQQQSWKAYKLQKEIVGRLAKAKLTDEQVGKIKTMCEQTVKDNADAPPTGGRGNEVVGKLYQSIVDQVLTDAQRTEMKSGGR